MSKPANRTTTPKPYAPKPGGLPDRVLSYIRAHGDVGYSNVQLCEALGLDIDPHTLRAYLIPAINHGALELVGGKPGVAKHWFLGSGKPEYPVEDLDEEDTPLKSAPIALPSPGVRSVFDMAQAQVATSGESAPSLSNSVSQPSAKGSSERKLEGAEGLAEVAQAPKVPKAFAAVAGEGAATPADPAAAAPVKPNHYAFGLFSDGRLVIEHDKAGALTLPAEATRQLVDFLDRMLATAEAA